MDSQKSTSNSKEVVIGLDEIMGYSSFTCLDPAITFSDFTQFENPQSADNTEAPTEFIQWGLAGFCCEEAEEDGETDTISPLSPDYRDALFNSAFLTGDLDNAFYGSQDTE